MTNTMTKRSLFFLKRRRAFADNLFAVSRFARVIAVHVPHHATQRGNARRFILDTDAERWFTWTYRGTMRNRSRCP
jgi:hypothetical protein